MKFFIFLSLNKFNHLNFMTRRANKHIIKKIRERHNIKGSRNKERSKNRSKKSSGTSSETQSESQSQVYLLLQGGIIA